MVTFVLVSYDFELAMLRLNLIYRWGSQCAYSSLYGENAELRYLQDWYNVSTVEGEFVV